MCAHPAALSTTAGTQTYFCLAELPGRHSSGNPGSGARPCSCPTRHSHLSLLRKSHLCPSGGTESQLGKNLSSKLSLSPGILPGVLWKFPTLPPPPPPNCCSVEKLIRDAAEAPNTYCSAKLFASHCAGYGEGGGGLISLSPKVGLLLKNSNTGVPPFYICCTVLMLFHLRDTDLVQ